MNIYKEKYLKYKTKYLKLKQFYGGSDINNPNGILTEIQITTLKIKMKKFRQELYSRVIILLGENMIEYTYIFNKIDDPSTTTDILEKIITLIEGGITSKYADELSKTSYSVEEILKYKNFAHNFISDILSFSTEQKGKLDELLKQNLSTSLIYYIVKNNKTPDEIKEIIDISKSDTPWNAILKARETSPSNHIH
jgi:hypothetical protein